MARGNVQQRIQGVALCGVLAGLTGACDSDAERATVDPAEPSLSLEEWAPTRVADIIDTNIEVNTADDEYIEVNEAGALFLKLHFEQLALGPDDTLWLLNAEHEPMQRLTAADAGTWSQSVPGDTVFLSIERAGDTAAHLVIDKLAVGTQPLFSPPADADADLSDRSICGGDNKQRAACFDGDVATSANTVARLLFPSGGGMSVCTGSLVSADNHFITNNHCIDSQADLNNTEFLFNFQKAGCSGSADATPESLSGGTFIRTSVGLDYTLVRLSGNPVATYGFLEIDGGPVSTGTEIYIPQHPGGRPKEVAIVEDGGNCQVRATNTSPFGYTQGSNVGYTCDTEGGSSGSPVLRAADHRMIALHHLGGCNNSGTKMQNILPEIAGDIGGGGGGGGGGDSASCEDRCGQFSQGAACQCDDQCEQFDDCCEDIDAQCGGGGEQPGPDSCVDSCGQNAGNCWCDTQCEQFGDCCANKDSVCG
ncbi:MAG: trypsin-like peptidase domain-containing protein [Myxococcota bacterium]